MNPTGETIVQEIDIKAPARRVFDALSMPDQRLQWWGSMSKPGAAPPTMESDLRPGGKWTMHFESWSGSPASVGGVYRTIEPPNVLAFTWLPSWYENPTETLVTFDLQEHAGVTTVRITHSGLVTDEDRASHQGWPHVLSALQAYVQSAA